MLGREWGRVAPLADTGILAHFVAAILLAALLFPSAVDGQARKQRRPKVGDRVEAYHLGRMEPGTITGFAATGWIFVSLDKMAAQGMPPKVFPPNQVRFAPEPPEERIWRDASGSFQISATLTTKDADTVTLKKADGDVITVPIDKLSKKDQDYVREQQLPVDRPESPPARPGPPDLRAEIEQARRNRQSASRAGMPGRGPSADASELDSLPVGDMSAMETIAMADPSAAWNYQPLPTPAFEAVAATRVDLPAGYAPGPNMRKCTLVASSDGSVAALGLGDPFSRQIELDVVDFKTGRLLATHKLPSLEFLPKDVAPQGPYVVTASTGTQRPEHVAFWRPSDGALQRVGGWRIPGKSSAALLRDVRFVGLSRVVTIDGSGELVIWNVRDGSAIAGCRVDPESGRAFNHDGTRMAALAEGAIHLFDLAAGKDLAAIAVSDPPARLGISSNGARLAGVGIGKLSVWDLTTGKLTHETTLQGDKEPVSVDWVDDRLVLVNTRDLVDVEVGLAFWGLSKGFDIKAVATAPTGNSCYLLEDNRQTSLFSFRLPLDRIMDAWKPVRESNLPTLEPGPVSIQMQDLPFSESEQEEIRSALTKQLQDRGFTIQSNAPMTLSLRVKRETTRKVGVREFGKSLLDDPDEIVTYTATTSEIELTQGQNRIWRQAKVNSPVGQVFEPQENESSQQAVDRLSRPKAGFFSQIVLPKPGLMLPGGKTWIGASSLTAEGLQ